MKIEWTAQDLTDLHNVYLIHRKGPSGKILLAEVRGDFSGGWVFHVETNEFPFPACTLEVALTRLNKDRWYPAYLPIWMMEAAPKVVKVVKDGT